MPYNWQWSNWPNFAFELREIESDLLLFSDKAGQIDGLLRGLPEAERNDALTRITCLEALKTSEIAGEYLSYSDVLSSLRNLLGANEHLEEVGSRAAEGIAELLLTVSYKWQDPLSEESLLAWHHILMRGSDRLDSGSWRTGDDPKRIFSNPFGTPKIQFEAPPSDQLPNRMSQFINWFNHSRNTILNPPVRSALAHLYFESILPFQDGNGRIGRVIADIALSQGLGRSIPISLSETIESNKNSYYEALREARQTYEVTSWIRFFLSIILESQKRTEEQIELVLRKTRYLTRHRDHLNKRQRLAITCILDNGPDRIEEGLTARSYMSLTDASKATATRDLQDLVQKEALLPIGSGRGSRYAIMLD